MRASALYLRAFFFLLMSALVFTFRVQAQEVDTPMKLKLAQSFEQAGEWERATTMYEDLYKREPANYIFFDGLRRGYTQLKRYDDAIQLVRKRLESYQNDPVLLSVLGGLYYESGKETAADSVWQLVVKKDLKNPALYRLVASQMMEHRLFDQAIKTYLSARERTNGQELFAEELASLYSALQQYGLATAEFVRLVRKTPEMLSYVESRISGFTLRSEGLKAAVSVVRQEVHETPQNPALHSLLAWLAMEGKDYEMALQEYRVIDKLNNANGREILNFAQRAIQEKAYRIAREAFREIAEQDPPSAMTPQARFGYARALEEFSAESDTTVGQPREHSSWPVSETQPSYGRAVELYGRIIADYPNSDWVGQAYFRIGLIDFNRFFDLNGAMSSFESARRSAREQNLRLDATLRLGDVLVSQNNLEQARREYSALLATGLNAYRDRALFLLAELDYFSGRFDSSLTNLTPLTANVNQDLANDALQLQYFIQENKTTAPVALSDFARADLLMRQRKYSEALVRFKEIARLNPSVLLLDDALVKIGELQLLLRQTNEAVQTFETVAEMQSSILRDRAQMRIGETFETVLKDKAKAIQAYERLLEKFPHSMYAEEARRRIRLLRGDAI